MSSARTDTGRFLSQDSYLGEINNAPSLHRYLHAYANPTVYVDPDGHFGIVAVGGTSTEILYGGAAAQQSRNEKMAGALNQTQEDLARMRDDTRTFMNCVFGDDCGKAEYEAKREAYRSYMKDRMSDEFNTVSGKIQVQKRRSSIRRAQKGRKRSARIGNLFPRVKPFRGLLETIQQLRIRSPGRQSTRIHRLESKLYMIMPVAIFESKTQMRRVLHGFLINLVNRFPATFLWSGD